MEEKNLDALTGLVFVILLLVSTYVKTNIDLTLARSFLWVFALLFHAYIFGKHNFPRKDWVTSSLLGVFLLFASQSIIQVIWFYSGHRLGQSSDVWALVVTIGIAHVSNLYNLQKSELIPQVDYQPQSKNEWTKKKIILTVLFNTAFAGFFIFLLISIRQAQTLNSIRTPWALLGEGVLPALSLLWIITIFQAFYLKSKFITLLNTVLTLFISLSFAPLIYQLGYGFDSFLHLAGERVLLTTGKLEPKPFYYMGQYVFLTWFSRFTGMSLTLINQWFITVITALLLPLSIFITFYKTKLQYSSLIVLVLLPLGLFIAPTPQALSLVVGLSGLILAMSTKTKDVSIEASLLLVFWSILIHPLSGIPFLLASLGIIFVNYKSKILNIAGFILAIITGFSIPIIFYFFSLISPTLNIDWQLNNLNNLSTWFSVFTKLIPWVKNSFTIWPQWATLVKISLPFFSFILALVGLKTYKYKKQILILLLSSLSLYIASSVLVNISLFNFLIQYEQHDYALRLFKIATYILIIAALPALALLVKRLNKTISIVSLLTVIFLSLIATAQTYNSLPRYDATEASHGWNVSQTDVKAVRIIDHHAQSKPYAVLANQTVSAAAVREFGFKRYIGDIFYYPIPTGGKLYELFLNMTYKYPNLATVRDTMKLTKSDIVFVVINDYWWKSDILNEKISKIADKEWVVDNGKIHVYAFNK